MRFLPLRCAPRASSLCKSETGKQLKRMSTHLPTSSAASTTGRFVDRAQSVSLNRGYAARILQHCHPGRILQSLTPYLMTDSSFRSRGGPIEGQKLNPPSRRYLDTQTGQTAQATVGQRKHHASPKEVRWDWVIQRPRQWQGFLHGGISKFSAQKGEAQNGKDLGVPHMPRWPFGSRIGDEVRSFLAGTEVYPNSQDL